LWGEKGFGGKEPVSFLCHEVHGLLQDLFPTAEGTATIEAGKEEQPFLPKRTKVIKQLSKFLLCPRSALKIGCPKQKATGLGPGKPLLAEPLLESFSEVGKILDQDAEAKRLFDAEAIEKLGLWQKGDQGFQPQGTSTKDRNDRRPWSFGPKKGKSTASNQRCVDECGPA
jgi:hypothetical protein